MNRAAAIPIDSTYPKSLDTCTSQIPHPRKRIATIDSDHNSLTTHAPSDSPQPAYQRGRPRSQTQLEKPYPESTALCHGSPLGKTSKSHHRRSRTFHLTQMSGSTLGAAHLLQSMLSDLSQHRIPQCNASFKNRSDFSTKAPSGLHQELYTFISPNPGENGQCAPVFQQQLDELVQEEDMFLEDSERDVCDRTVLCDQSHLSDVMPWLSEAIETVNALESRIKELEQDCKAIPLYKQEQEEMAIILQDLESKLQYERDWRRFAENSISKVIHILDQELGSQSCPAHPLANVAKSLDRTQGCIVELEGGNMQLGSPVQESEVLGPITVPPGRPFNDILAVALKSLREINSSYESDREDTNDDYDNGMSPNPRNVLPGPQLNGLGIIELGSEETNIQQVNGSTGSLPESVDSMMDSASDSALLSASMFMNPTNRATNAGSAQTLATDLGCMVDERVYLKQHVLTLDRMRIQNQQWAERAEEEHRHRVRDLQSFSQKMLESVGVFTLAQASLDGSADLVIAALQGSTVDTPNHPNYIQTSWRTMDIRPEQQLNRSVLQMECAIRTLRNLASVCVDIAERSYSRCGDICEGLHKSPILRNVPRSDNQENHATSTLSVPTASTSCFQQQNLSNLVAPTVTFDETAFRQFVDHVTVLRSQTQSTIKFSMSMLLLPMVMDTHYMKCIMEQDIRPCLLINQGQTNRSSKYGGWISSMLQSTPLGRNGTDSSFHQRLLDAIENRSCEIELWSKTPNQPWSSNSGHASELHVGVPFAQKSQYCCLCRETRSCEYRLRLLNPSTSRLSQVEHTNVTPKEERGQCFPLDKFCRQRIVAVCDFFMFLAHIHQGLLNRQSDKELYQRSLTLQYRMAIARIGGI
ncbi:hypothetical protein BGZ94_000261 [Podila epigama]|nr:hypothetical protein BGZ94_000261 [Podila epigama]